MFVFFKHNIFSNKAFKCFLLLKKDTGKAPTSVSHVHIRRFAAAPGLGFEQCYYCKTWLRSPLHVRLSSPVINQATTLILGFYHY